MGKNDINVINKEGMKFVKKKAKPLEDFSQKKIEEKELEKKNIEYKKEETLKEEPKKEKTSKEETPKEEKTSKEEKNKTFFFKIQEKKKKKNLPKEKDFLLEENQEEKKIPIISILGHIDSGKTSFLDRILNLNVAEKEPGGITQNISTYNFSKDDKSFILVDTPGHGTFRDIRNLIIEVSDLVVVIINATAGIQEETKDILEKAKKVFICVNKIDLISKNEREILMKKIFNELTRYNLYVQEYGGDIDWEMISSLKNENIEKTLDKLFLQDLGSTVNKKIPGVGRIIDIVIEKGLSFVATILLEFGEVKLGDEFFYNNFKGKVKNIFHNNNNLKEINCDSVFQISGFSEEPKIGDKIYFVNKPKTFSFEPIIEKKAVIRENSRKFIVKSNSASKLNALLKVLDGEIISSGLGEFSDSEKKEAEEKDCLLVFYGKHKEFKGLISDEVIYKIIEKIEQFYYKPPEKIIIENGKAQVIKIFNINDIQIAGCRIIDGFLELGQDCKIMNNDKLIGEGKISSIQMNKETLKKATLNQEVGLIIKVNYIPFKDFGLNNVIIGLYEQK